MERPLSKDIMDIENVKLPWNEILESYISYYENLRPELNIRTHMAPIIADLNENKIKSRVILSTGKVACYAFYLQPDSMSDRNYGVIGFVSEEVYESDRLINLLDWLYAESGREGRMVMINEIFNARDYDTILTGKGFQKIERDQMELVLRNLPELGLQPEGSSLETATIDASSINEFIGMHEISFAGTKDSVLDSSIRTERQRFWITLFEGKAFGQFLKDTCLWLKDGQRIVGAIIVTLYESAPFIATFFILPEQRGKGFGEFLLLTALNILKREGYEKVSLWVTRGNSALPVYERVGFNRMSGSEEVIYFKESQ